MATIGSNTDIVYTSLPKHGFLTSDTKTLANIFYELLCDEAREVIKHNENIYILLTGGLDSRIIAAIFATLYKNGELKKRPHCLTWGQSNSRDVFYAELIAKSLELHWEHIPLTPNTIIENIEKCGEYLGLLHSPEMLHSMLALEKLPANAMVIAGSYGDSIGRAEFSNLHLLQLDHKIPHNAFEILHPEIFEQTSKELLHDLQLIHQRGGDSTQKYMQCEYWMQGYRMRNGLCHALSVINRFAEIYQMFTHLKIISFIWSLHPSRRDDDIYTEILIGKFPELAKIPWARTNKPFIGKYKNKSLKAHYHDYTIWSSGILFGKIKKLVDPDWFATKQIFNPEQIVQMNKTIRESKQRVGRINDIWLWLAGFRYYIDQLENQSKEIIFKPIEFDGQNTQPANTLQKQIRKKVISIASNSTLINNSLKNLRNTFRKLDLKKQKKLALKNFPPVPYEKK